jgi:hypothetical protein
MHTGYKQVKIFCYKSRLYEQVTFKKIQKITVNQNRLKKTNTDDPNLFVIASFANSYETIK